MNTLSETSSPHIIHHDGYTIVPFWELNDETRAEVDEVFSVYSQTDKAKAAPVVPLERGEINNCELRPFGAVAFADKDGHPASYLGATTPVRHNGRRYAEVGSMMTPLDEDLGHRLGQYTLKQVVAQLHKHTGDGENDGIVPIASANGNSYKNFKRNGFRLADNNEVPPSVTNFCRDKCPIGIPLGGICCDKIMVLPPEEAWEHTEGGLYVPANA